LELPIDHFRLLGLSPAADLHTLLRTLQLRIDRAPDQGYTLETLQAREDLLRASAELLSNSQRRAAYEAELTALSASEEPLQAALELPSSKEVAGLLLLLEAGMALECFELANRALQPPQAPALGSGREADLCLVAAHACLSGAEELKERRRYESAAELLGQGMQLLQRMGQQPQLRQQMGDAQQILRPFRVLDLLSRDLSSQPSRQEGLRLLEELVRERGGLEGNDDPHLSREEFEAFFRQIRAYLTVQEQIDLFSSWAKAPGASAATADFLATSALTASGFAQRKPERIASAREQLQASGQSDVLPLLACLHLLLGQVDAAEQAFQEGASPELKRWAAQVSGEEGDTLAQLCAYCRDWLARDVLPGYRDLEADADLEAYFADRDVQAFLDRLAPPASRAPATSEFGSFGDFSFGNLGELSSETGTPAFAKTEFGTSDLGNSGFGGFGSPFAAEPGNGKTGQGSIEGQPDEGWLDEGLPPWLETLGERLQSLGGPRSWPRALQIGAATAATVVVAGGVISLLRSRPASSPVPVAVQPAPTAASGSAPAKSPSAQAPAQPAKPPSQASAAPTPPPPPAPLTASEPSAAQVQALLEAWLDAKASVLAGKSSTIPLEQMARGNEVSRLEAERRDDQAQQQSQRIDASIRNFTLESSSPNRIAAIVTLSYTDQRLDAGGNPVGKPTRLEGLRNRYVFGRDGERWRLVSYEPVN
jgi:hypothetical protein